MLSAELHVAKEDFKFSAAHFIVHADTRERLHGHNYRVAMSVRGAVDPGSGYVLDFGTIKRAARSVCASLDERFLCPTANPHIACTLGTELTITVLHDGARFVMPVADAVLLPIANVSVEALARVVAERLVLHGDLAPYVGKALQQLSVSVTETAGQEAKLTFDAAKLAEEAEEARALATGSTANPLADGSITAR
jgi:6-pyruvoyltetrahydropterin/6-carboxytetrahydropterin synthase